MSDPTKRTHQDPRGPDREEDIRRLIRLAGRRPAVPLDRAARVRAAARAEWADVVMRRRRRRFLWMGTALGAAAAAVLVVLVAPRIQLGPAAPPAAATYLVESIAGDAWVEAPSGSQHTPLRAQDRLSFGTSIATAPEGRVALRLATTGSVRIDGASRLRLSDADTLVLESGTVYVDSGREGAGVAPLVVRTPFGPVREVGTQFEVQLSDGAIRLRVREGSVTLEAPDRMHEVPAAHELTIEGSGVVRRRAIPVHGEIWEWVAAIATLPDMEGLSARVFLDHVARERGWTLRFTDDQVAREADRITLGGALDGLRLEDALDAVLPTCGMTHAVEAGTLIVSRADDAP